MEQHEDVVMVIDMLKELSVDDSVPRNVKSKMQDMIQVLNSDDSLAIRVNKVLSELDEISEDTNIQPHTRTQIWGLASLLESIDTD